VRALRDDGLKAYFTIDAGPQVKVLCGVDDRAAVAEALREVPGVHRVLLSQPGGSAELLELA
jgi:diphosphomevalonate decarboxylase